MSAATSIINKWVPHRLVVPLLVLALFPHLMLLSLFSMNATFTASFLDIEPDDLQFLFAIAYATIIGGLFIYTRLWEAFNVRSYCLLATILNIIVLVAMTMTTNRQLILVLRFIQGPLALFEGVILLPVIMSNIRSTHAKFMGYIILYFMMMTSDKFSTSIVKFAIEHYTHEVMFCVVIGFHCIALLIYLLVLNSNRMFPKKPLYQLHIGGIILLMFSLLSGAFFFIYGKRLNWFDSQLIVLALISCLFFAALFIFHQKTSKRPLYHFEVFKSERVVLGVILFFVFYLMRSSLSNVYQVMGLVWKWPWEYILEIQYINVAGTFLGSIIAYLLFTREVSFKRIFIIGFIFICVSMYWFSCLFLPDTTVESIGKPLFLEGVGQGVIFAPLVFYMLGSVHMGLTTNVSQTGTAIRFWTTTIGFSLMQNLVWMFSAKYELLLTQNLQLTQQVYQQEWSSVFEKYGAPYLINDANHLSGAIIKEKIVKQALLLANTEIFRGLFIFCLIAIIVIISYSYIKRILPRKKVKEK